MATKRIPLKRRRLGPQAEAAAWADLFETSYDFFDELEPLGFANGDDAGKSAAAETAWRRLGSIYLARRDPARVVRPWALEHFGDPDGDKTNTN